MPKKKPKDTEFVTLDQEQYAKLLNGLQEFEEKFYTILAESDRFEIIPIPDHKGRILPDETYSQIKHELARQGIKLLYRISFGNYAVVVNPDSLKRVGLVPDGAVKEFSC